jgi:hypothetical protein
MFEYGVAKDVFDFFESWKEPQNVDVKQKLVTRFWFNTCMAFILEATKFVIGVA